MKDVVQKWDKDLDGESNTRNTSRTMTTSTVSSVPSETSNIYRQIRSSNIASDDSQAVSCQEEDDKFKVINWYPTYLR